jgi:hypothetical protein
MPPALSLYTRIMDYQDDIEQIIPFSRRYPKTQFAIFNAAEPYLVCKLAEPGIDVMGPCLQKMSHTRRFSNDEVSSPGFRVSMVDAGVNSRLARGTTDDNFTV